MKRIRAQMQQIVDELGFDGDINDFIAFLREDLQFYATSAEDLLKEASFIAKKMDANSFALWVSAKNALRRSACTRRYRAQIYNRPLHPS